MISQSRRGISHLFDDQDEFGQNRRDPMDEFMGKIEREFFGGSSGLFGMPSGSSNFSRFDFDHDHNDHAPP